MHRCMRFAAGWLLISAITGGEARAQWGFDGWGWGGWGMVASPESAATLTVTAVDRAGNVAASSPLAFETPPPLPPIVITEVLANAAGPEPAQEFVELRNLGSEPVSLAGLRLEDAKGGDDLPAEMLAPDAYALVVPSGYDPAQGQDPAPRTGTLLVGSVRLSPIRIGEAKALLLGPLTV